MYKQFLSIVIAIGFCGSAVAFAQSDVPPGLEKKLAAAEDNLKKVEAVIAKVARGKVIKDEDMKALDNAMMLHAVALGLALDDALAEVEKSAKAEETPVNTKALARFERVAQNHEKRAKKVSNKALVVEAKIKMGDMQLDRSVTEKMSPEEKGKFKKYLDPRGRRKMEILQPDIFETTSPAGGDSVRAESMVSLCAHPFSVDPVTGFVRELPELVASPADAAINAAAIYVCGQSAGTLCIAAKVSAKLASIGATNLLNRCLSGCASWKWWCKAGCWTAYIALLA